MTDGAGVAAVPRRRLSGQLESSTSTSGCRSELLSWGRRPACGGPRTYDGLAGDGIGRRVWPADPQERGPRAVYGSEVCAAPSVRRPS